MTIEISEELILKAFMETVFSRDENGNYSKQANDIVSQTTWMFRDNEEIKDRLEELVIAALPDLVPLVLNKILQGMVVENQGGWNQNKQLLLANWAQRPLQDALATALEKHAKEYVDARFPEGIVDRYDMQVNINLVPKD